MIGALVWVAARAAALLAVLVAFHVGVLMWRALARLSVVAIAFAILLVWSQLLVGLANRQPAAEKLDKVKIGWQAKSVVLGRKELMQIEGPQSAGERQVELRREANPSPGSSNLVAWSLANIAPRRKLLLLYCDRPDGKPDPVCQSTHAGSIKMLADRLPIEKGDVLELSPESGSKEVVRIDELDTKGRPESPDKGQIVLGIGPPGASAARHYTLEWSLGHFSLTDGGGNAVAGCRPSPFALLNYVHRLSAVAHGLRDETTLLHFGGETSCVNDDAGTIGLEGTRFFSQATIAFVPGVGFVFARDHDPGARVDRGSQSIWLGSIAHPLIDTIKARPVVLDGFIAGRTHYAIEPGAPDEPRIALQIVPVAKSHRLVAVEPCQRNEKSDTVGVAGVLYKPLCAVAQRAAWATAPGHWLTALVEPPLVGLMLLAQWSRSSLEAFGAPASSGARLLGIAEMFGVAIALLLFARMRRAIDSRSAVELGLRQVAVGLAVLTLAGYALGKQYPLWLAAAEAAQQDVPVSPWPALAWWAVAILAVATARGSRILDNAIMAVWTAIVALGHCALLAMSLEAAELSRLRFADDTTHVIAAAAALVVLVAQIGPDALAAAIRRLVFGPRWLGLPPGLWVVGAATVMTLAAWLAFGTETGIAGFLQPSEIVKTLVVLALSAGVTLALDRERGRDAATPLLMRAHGVTVLRRPRRIRLIVAVAVAALGLALIVGRAEIGRHVGDQALVELIGFALLPVSAVLLFRLIDDPMWAAFFLIAAVAGAIEAVPVFRNDLSPFLVIGATCIGSLLIVVIVHWVAIGSERLELRQRERAPPPTSWRPPQAKETDFVRFDRPLVARLLGGLRWTWRFLWWRPFELAAVAGMGACVAGVLFAASMLTAAGSWREYYVNLIGSGHDKPYNRLISWIELNAAPEQGGGRIAVEFVDVGLQVLHSRAAIERSRCDDWRIFLPEQHDRQAASSANGDMSSLVEPAASVVEAALTNVSPLAEAAAECPTASPATSVADRELASGLSMPEIQNDFIGTWLILVLGRAGAVELILLQCTLAGFLLVAAFRVVKWTPAHIRNRPAASVAAYATVAFALMLSLQWAISWANALGVVPVMGQPATFLSHGPSHFLLFGVPAIVTSLCALRVRSALTVLPDRDDLPAVPWLRLRLLRRR